MKAFLRLRYWNPLRKETNPLPGGLKVSVYDEDIGFHDHIGEGTTGGDILELTLKGWGEYDPPDIYFEVVTGEKRIDLRTNRLLEPGEESAGPHLWLPPGRWDSREQGPGRVFDNIDPLTGLGSPDAPLEVRLEAGTGAFYSPVYWNRLGDRRGQDRSSKRGSFRPVPAGVTFHLRNGADEKISRGAILPDGLLYMPIWKPEEELRLYLDADYAEPLVINLKEERLANRRAREEGGDFLTITSWHQGLPTLSPATPQLAERSASSGAVGSESAPVVVDIAASPWTTGNQIKYLIDGNETYLAMAESIREAKHSIHLIGWDFRPNIWMERLSGIRDSIADLLLKQAAANPAIQVKVLVWANPANAITLRSSIELFQSDPRNKNQNVEMQTSSCSILRSHHQKMMVVDGEIGFVGGIDVAYGRWDTQLHIPGWNRQGENEDSQEGGDFAVPTWHDIHTRVQGPAVALLEKNFAARWGAATDARPANETKPGQGTFKKIAAHQTKPASSRPAPSKPKGVPILVARTWPKEMDGGLSADFDETGIRTQYLRAIGDARQSVYIEQQYFNNKGLTKAIAKRIQWAITNKIKDFRVTLVLPSRYDDPPPVARHIAFLQEECLTILRRTDPEERHLRLFCLRTWNPDTKGYEPVYIHAKLLVVDERWTTVGSANANNRSFTFDTELNLAIEDRRSSKELLKRLLEEHACGHVPVKHSAAIDLLHAQSRANQKALESDELGPNPELRRIFPHAADTPPVRLPMPQGSDIMF